MNSHSRLCLKMSVNAMATQMYSNTCSLYHACSDTVGRSGMLCAMMSTIERCKTEGVVDVLKALRVQKPGAVQTVVCSKIHLLIEIITSIYYLLTAYRVSATDPTKTTRRV